VRFFIFGLLLFAHNAFAQEWSWDWMRFGSNGQTLFFDRLVLKKRNLNEYSVNLKYKNNPCFDKAQVDNLNYEKIRYLLMLFRLLKLVAALDPGGSK